MNTQSLRERLIYAAPITACPYNTLDTRDVVTHYREQLASDSLSGDALLRAAINHSNNVQADILRTLEFRYGLERVRESSPIWGDWILERTHWNRTQLYVVVQALYEKLDIVLDSRGHIVGVTEAGEAYAAVELTTDRYTWPFATGLDLPALAEYEIPAAFLLWQQRVIENIWYAPTRHCHVCGSRTVSLGCSHTSSVISAIQGECAYVYARKDA